MPLAQPRGRRVLDLLLALDPAVARDEDVRVLRDDQLLLGELRLFAQALELGAARATGTLERLELRAIADKGKAKFGAAQPSTPILIFFNGTSEKIEIASRTACCTGLSIESYVAKSAPMCFAVASIAACLPEQLLCN